LYQNETFASVEFCSFAKDLSCKVAELFGTQNNKVTFYIDEKEVYLDIDTAVPLGLILNELVTNSYKYFLKESQENTITIAINSSSKGVYELIYRDNGPGLKEGIDVDTATSLGLKLIRGLAKQLHGTASYRFDNGSVFVIKFKNLEARNE
jgi:two-component sensor histidine kinase